MNEVSGSTLLIAEHEQPRGPAPHAAPPRAAAPPQRAPQAAPRAQAPGPQMQRAQEDAMKQQRQMQEEQARQMQRAQQQSMPHSQPRQAEDMQRAMQKQQQDQQRQAEKQQQDQQRQAEKQQQDQQRQAEKMQQEEQRNQERASQRQPRENENAQNREQERGNFNQNRNTSDGINNARGEEGGRPNANAASPNGRNLNPAQNQIDQRHFGAAPRPSAPAAPIRGAVAIDRAFHSPKLISNANPQMQREAQQFQHNLQTHLAAVPASQAPTNYAQTAAMQGNSYTNNYQTTVNNIPITINRQNTYYNPIPQNQWPSWYQPRPNWNFCNGFILGSAVNCGLDWFRWGWPSCYGPPPQGFICQAGYFPTPWIYVPYNGEWRQPGVFGYDPYGPDGYYTGPISVEVIEPVPVTVVNPYNGMPGEEIVNQVVMYNAFYYPEFGRWGYMNDQGYFIWVNTNVGLY